MLLYIAKIVKKFRYALKNCEARMLTYEVETRSSLWHDAEAARGSGYGTGHGLIGASERRIISRDVVDYSPET